MKIAVHSISATLSASLIAIPAQGLAQAYPVGKKIELPKG